MIYDRFDFAVLSLFTYAFLGEPWTVREEDDYLWSVWQSCRRIGTIVGAPHGGYRALKSEG